MAVVVTETSRAWWNYQVHDLTAGDIVPDGEFATHLLATGAPVVVQTDTTPDVNGDGVPDGTAKDVLAWVGDDPARASLALEAEGRRETPRKTLTAELEKLSTPAPVVEVAAVPPVEGGE